MLLSCMLFSLLQVAQIRGLSAHPITTCKCLRLRIHNFRQNGGRIQPCPCSKQQDCVLNQ